ncbi:MAG: TrbI/VirB10 family protein [Lentisphaeraceae bacterium]|nr:TrbI/VirB10 family protein [Lentisphaeraceae bacterium]
MNKIKDFLGTPLGKGLAFMLVVAFALVTVKGMKAADKDQKKSSPKQDFSLFEDGGEISNPYEEFKGDFKNKDSGNPVPHQELAEILKDKKENIVPPPTVQTYQDPADFERLREQFIELEYEHQKLLDDMRNKKVEEKVEFKISPTSLGRDTTEKSNETLFHSERFAPFGRLIKCMLVTTVDSANLTTPIIATVIEDVFHDGVLVIPAGVEVHGRAATVHLRDRIGTDKDWVLVWRQKGLDNGKELPIKAFPLDYSYNSRTKKYGITDGTAGLRGKVIETDDYQKLKLYATTFIQGVSEGLFQTIQAQNTDTSQLDESDDQSRVNNDQQIRAGASRGLETVTKLYAQQILEEIKEHGSYVRVAGGTYFYLYVQETLDVANAQLGAKLLSAPQKSKQLQEKNNNGAEKPQIDLDAIFSKRLAEREKIRSGIK